LGFSAIIGVVGAVGLIGGIMQEFITETVTRKRADNSPAGYYTETVDVEIALDGVKLGAFKGKWDTCALCNYTAPANDMGYIDGRPFCYKYGCYPSKAYELTRGDL